VSVRTDSGNSSEFVTVFGKIEAKVTRETLMYLGRGVIPQEMSAPVSGKFADDELFGQRGYEAADSFSIPGRSASDQDITHRGCDG
jgi:hypothetical protein